MGWAGTASQNPGRDMGRDRVLIFCHRVGRDGILSACPVPSRNVPGQPQDRREKRVHHSIFEVWNLKRKMKTVFVTIYSRKTPSCFPLNFNFHHAIFELETQKAYNFHNILLRENSNLKSNNLQCNTMVLLVVWTNDSSTKGLMFQVLFLFHNFLQNCLQELFQFILYFFFINLHKQK